MGGVWTVEKGIRRHRDWESLRSQEPQHANECVQRGLTMEVAEASPQWKASEAPDCIESPVPTALSTETQLRVSPWGTHALTRGKMDCQMETQGIHGR